jgi:hypothetical protein
VNRRQIFIAPNFVVKDRQNARCCTCFRPRERAKESPTLGTPPGTTNQGGNQSVWYATAGVGNAPVTAGPRQCGVSRKRTSPAPIQRNPVGAKPNPVDSDPGPFLRSPRRNISVAIGGERPCPGNSQLVGRHAPPAHRTCTGETLKGNRPTGKRPICFSS